MQDAGIDPADIVTMSTHNGALTMGRLGDFGTLEAGKIADLIVLDEDPTADVRAFRSLTHVMRAGVLRPQEELAWRGARRDRGQGSETVEDVPVGMAQMAP